jgi:hypothetical protein
MSSAAGTISPTAASTSSTPMTLMTSGLNPASAAPVPDPTSFPGGAVGGAAAAVPPHGDFPGLARGVTVVERVVDRDDVVAAVPVPVPEPAAGTARAESWAMLS